MRVANSNATTDHNHLTYLRPPVAELKRKLDAFVNDECIPYEAVLEQHLQQRAGGDRWTTAALHPGLKALQQRAQSLGLWNLFLPPHLLEVARRLDPTLVPRVALTYREYGVLCESMGRSPWVAPEACNCSAPDTGNMEVLLEFGTPEQQSTYLLPLMRGEIRSAFLMTEPNVASSDPTNLETELRKVGKDSYVLSGTKWWSTGAMDPRCKFYLVVARVYHHNEQSSTAPTNRHGAHTVVLVPRSAPGITMEKALTVFGYDDAPHGHAQVRLENVALSSKDLILGEGSGFRVSQARLGPGRIHHCMRAVGMGT